MNVPQHPPGVPGDKRPVVRVDVRRRVSLARNTRVQSGDLFFINVGNDGVITLTPARAVPEWAIDTFATSD